jgi:hypothetical protein
MPHASTAVIAHIQGGLGNQLFCYAVGRALSLRAGTALRLNTRAGFRKEKYGRDCLLRRFNIDAPEAGWWEGFHDPLGRSRRSWLAKLNDRRPIDRRTLIKEPADQRYLPELTRLEPTRDVYLVGYWQDERYFADARAALQRELQTRPDQPFEPDPAVDALTRQPEAVSVHCRSYGEVANLRPGVRLDAGYYREALSRMRERVPEARFVVFSDKPEWARALIDEAGHADRAVFAPANHANPTTATLTDFRLMARCRHHVVANSSFSWWTAWLGEREGSVVLAPPGGLLGNGRFPERWLEHLP